jgi:anti-sigma regulatory factor (Ser/Thr protein kinase)
MTATSRAGQYEQVRREHMAEDNHVRDINGLTLAAVATAAGCSRLFARSTLRQWGLVRMVDDSELVISELVTNAVEATGVTDPQPRWRELADLAVIRARLLLYHTRVVIDVWDRAQEAPFLKEPNPEDDYGRGLSIVDALCVRWSYFYPRTGGKVVWAELAIPPHQYTLRGLPSRPQTAKQHPPTGVTQSPELLRRVRDGLNALYADSDG